MRKAIFAANWKMNKISQEAEVFINSLLNNPLPTDRADVLICAPFLSLPILSKVISEEQSEIKLGAQNFYPEESGAYTGEIAPSMLDELGINYVIIGHSERREYFNESDEFINRKVKMALKWDFNPILCVGENLEERELGITNDKIAIQIKKDLHGLDSSELKKVIIAYEPIWAIGTGKSASDEDALEVIRYIRNLIDNMAGEKISDDIRVLYGGSMKPGNVADYMKHKDIDGGLIGGASLKPDSFKELIENGLGARK